MTPKERNRQKYIYMISDKIKIKKLNKYIENNQWMTPKERNRQKYIYMISDKKKRDKE